MRCVFYCQHVLGVGHLFRSLEIARALAPHEVHLVTGGPEAPVRLPDNVVHQPIPALRMDADFCQLYATDPECCVADVQAERLRKLLDIMRAVRPAVLLVELYPFGRKQFGCELAPLLDHVKAGVFGPCAAVCSLRDILVEKKDPAKYEKRVLDKLNGRFDGLLVHADPRLVSLDETFSRTAELKPELVYTGYVARGPDPGARERVRAELGLLAKDKLIVASAGGGAVGQDLLQSAVAASNLLHASQPHTLLAFTGPFTEQRHFDMLRHSAAAHQTIERFSLDFPSLLAAADLSVSLAGYNTTMNLLACRTFGLVKPFDQNREQRMRAQRLQERGQLRILEQDDLRPDRLAALMAGGLGVLPSPHGLDLDGAANSAASLLRWARELGT